MKKSTENINFGFDILPHFEISLKLCTKEFNPSIWGLKL